MNVARRRSGLFRSTIGAPPKATRGRAAAPPIKEADPATIPRQSAPGGITIGAAACRPPSRLPGATISATGRASLPERSAMAKTSTSSHSRPALQSTASRNTTLTAASTSRQLRTGRPPPPSTQRSTATFSLKPSVARARPVAQKPILPSKVTLLEERNAQLEREMAEATDFAEHQKSKIQFLDGKLEGADRKLISLQDQLSTLKEVHKSKMEECEEYRVHNNDLRDLLNEKEAELRKLHNDVVDLRGQIRVAVRVRPLIKSEVDTSSSAIEYPAVDAIKINEGSKPGNVVKFENVFTPVFSQKEVFANVEEFIRSSLHGYNVGLIAYGQTGSGKTHTMRGGNGEEEGIIPRAAAFLFAESKKLESLGWKFDFSLSFLEVYNNVAYDLLSGRDVVQLRLNDQTVSMIGLSEHTISNVSDVARLLRVADGGRKTAATKCNGSSSRSHAVYMWKIKAHQPSTGISTTCQLKLVDLAGSERAKESGVSGDQFKEMTNINQSLSILQMCISQQRSQKGHVSYRDSKLTQVLMDCLGRGSSKTMVVVNLNPCNEQATESKRSIEFASKMRSTHIGSAVQQRTLLGDVSQMSMN
ncbi:Kinesin motor domain-containing protein [Caenorhabditis elegans]|uniref:Kinesin like protein n=1 Tax=Caenorhabditis elegans TaxID=6239 RepID=G5ECC0_CAEEL|nr:Kinesin motor domain-containing protein [Caenorhabditis elegans]BAA92264.1 kinesin like protein [Caenorhabditis elegans]CAB02839.1 Kinesin motor domain-containing protein [Caenorhabditis elegans]|eukprot:NP_492527.1 Kinesin-like protein [Caenorhabditis elegans]